MGISVLDILRIEMGFSSTEDLFVLAVPVLCDLKSALSHTKRLISFVSSLACTGVVQPVQFCIGN